MYGEYFIPDHIAWDIIGNLTPQTDTLTKYDHFIRHGSFTPFINNFYHFLLVTEHGFKRE